MTYVDGFVAAVPTANKDAFEKHAKEAAALRSAPEVRNQAFGAQITTKCQIRTSRA